MIFQTQSLVKENKTLLPFSTYPGNEIARDESLNSGNRFENILSRIVGKEDNISVEDNYGDRNPLKFRVNNGLKGEEIREDSTIKGEEKWKDEGLSENVSKSENKKENKKDVNDVTDTSEKLRLKKEIENFFRKFLRDSNGDELTKLEFKNLIDRLEKLLKVLLKKLMQQSREMGLKKGRINDESNNGRSLNLKNVLKKFLGILEGLKSNRGIEKNRLFGDLDNLIDDLGKEELAWFLKEIKIFEKSGKHGIAVNNGSLASNIMGKSVLINEANLNPSLNGNGGEEKYDPLNKLKVTDLRGKESGNKHHENSKRMDSKNISVNKEGSSRVSASNARTGVEFRSGNFVDMLKSDSNASNLTAESSHGKITRSFSGVIARIKELLDAKGFKQGNIVVRDGENGEIRLVLKPKNLGNVRIKLNIFDNRIEGKIFVENSSVKAILNNSMASLRDALKEGGFQSAFLEVSVSGESGDNGRERGNFKDTVGQSRKVVEKIDSLIPKVVEIGRDDLVINMVV